MLGCLLGSTDFSEVVFVSFFKWDLFPLVAGKESNWEERRNGWLHSRVFCLAVQQVSLNATGTLYNVAWVCNAIMSSLLLIIFMLKQKYSVMRFLQFNFTLCLQISPRSINMTKLFKSWLFKELGCTVSASHCCLH